jgi:general secretion pathway protein H
MVKKVAAVQPRTSSLLADRARSEHGFALIEIVCVLAIVGLLAAIVLPAIPRATSGTRLEAYALEAAALLKADRNAARRTGRPMATQISASTRLIRSGATGRIVRLPPDVTLNAMLAAKCANQARGSTIDFYPSGMSCGGVIALAGPSMKYEVRVNWLTGGIEIVRQAPT